MSRDQPPPGFWRLLAALKKVKQKMQGERALEAAELHAKLREPMDDGCKPPTGRKRHG